MSDGVRRDGLPWVVASLALLVMAICLATLLLLEDRFEAMIEAGRVRIRPIMLTSITTFLGISPLIFFATGQTAFLSPMAVSLGFGLLFATVLTLGLVPVLYSLFFRVRFKGYAYKAEG